MVSGAEQSSGAGLVEGLLKQGYEVAATVLRAGQSPPASPCVVLVDGDTGGQETAVKTVNASVQRG